MSTTPKPIEATFASYGKSFQEKILQALLFDQKWAEQLMEVFDVSYFEQKYLIFLAERYFKYAEKYKVFPTMSLLATIIKDDLHHAKDALLRQQVIEYLVRMKENPSPGDLGFVKDKTLDFCRKQALKAALETAVDHMASAKYEQCVEVVKKAVMVGTTPSVGHDFFEEFESRFVETVRNCVPTGMPEIDRKDILNGGLGKGELGVVVAPTGVGKSHWLTYVGANALKAGFDVLHYTMELSETQVGIRYDSNLCEIDSSNVVENKTKVIERYKDKKLGRLFIKQYPMNSATVYTIKSHVERLNVTKGFNPALIIIDYADIMRSTRQFDSLRHELKLVYEELRGFAVEMGFPIWTASQSNKGGSDGEIVDLGNMSEAYGKAMVADIVVTLSRKAQEKASGHGRLYVAKNRAGRDGIIYPITIDTARSNFTVSGDVGSFNENKLTDEAQLKRDISRRLKELQSDPNIQLTAATKAEEV